MSRWPDRRRGKRGGRGGISWPPPGCKTGKTKRDRDNLLIDVRDGNDPGGTKGGYNRFIADDQKAWLENELTTTKLPVIIMIQQPLDLDAGTLAIQGHASEWGGPDPWERGAPENDYPRDKNRPAISNWSGPIREKP